MNELKRYNKILDILNDGIIRIDKDSIITYVNPAIARMLRYSEEELKGRLLFELMDSEDRTLVEQYFERLRVGIDEEHDFEFTRKDGEKVYTIIKTTPFHDVRGNYFGAIAAVTDVTGRRNQERALRESQIRFEQIANHSRTIIWEVDQNGLYTYVNPMVQDILGYTVDEMVGKVHFYDLHPESGREEFMRKSFDVFDRRGVFTDLDNAVQTKDNYTIWVITNGLPLLNDDGTLRGYRGTDYDNTSRRLARIHLEQSVELLKHLSHYQTEAREAERAAIASIIHDELGQAMTALKLDLQYISKSIDVENRDRVERMITRTDEIVCQLQNLTAELRPGMLDDLGLVAAIEWYVQEFQSSTGIECSCELGELCLENQDIELTLFRILQEALTNVARHAEATMVDVKAYCQQDILYMEIADNGKGIPEEKLNSYNSFGLIGMRERAQYFNGTMEIFVDNGTRLKVSVPFSSCDTTGVG